MSGAISPIPDILEEHEADLRTDWLKQLSVSIINRQDLMSAQELQTQCRDIQGFMPAALRADPGVDLAGPAWDDLRNVIARMSRTRTEQGFTPSETANFILSFKSPLFKRLRLACGPDAETLFTAITAASDLLDKLALFTTEIHMKTREQLILRQQQEMLELSTPVVKLWDGILALPLIGTLDSSRTQVIMENLLQAIADTGSPVAIIDITGVPTVDTLVAQHLMRTVAAARLMGADCIISGIRPQIAQTIVHLAIDLGNITTRATLADAFAVALRQTGRTVSGSAPKA